ncbi:MAG: SpoIID/LytB domain-containing protein [Nitrospinae bacterium]|nr:SpoIID/LytB domain-containing protein [Nitrospinota bacterium]
MDYAKLSLIREVARTRAGGVSRLLAATMMTALVVIPASANGNTVRIAVDKGFKVSASSNAPMAVRFEPEECHQGLDGAKLITARATRVGMDINGHATACRTVLMESPEPIRVGSKDYPGLMILARDGSGITAVNHVDMEDYIASVISSEMGSNWPLEALKAQAVASRTFAMYQMERSREALYDMESTVRSQVYRGLYEGDRVKEAVDSTRGLIAVYDGAPAGTFYHSSSGGRTENPREVWGRERLPYLASKPALFEERSPHFNWRLRLSAGEIRDKLKKAGFTTGSVISIEPVSFTSSGRVARLRLVLGPNKRKVELRGEYFRKIIGDTRLPSTKFRVAKDSSGAYTFIGQGYGHGVGMSQWSARGLADHGRGFEEIIQAFYPGVTIAPFGKQQNL